MNLKLSMLFLAGQHMLPAGARAQNPQTNYFRQMLQEASRITLAGEEMLVYGVPQATGLPKAYVLETQMFGKRLRVRLKGDYQNRFVDLGRLRTTSADHIVFPDGQSVPVEILALPPRHFQGDRLDVFDRPGL